MSRSFSRRKDQEGYLHPLTLFALTILFSFLVFTRNPWLYGITCAASFLILLSRSARTCIKNLVFYAGIFGVAVLLAHISSGFTTGAFLGLAILILQLFPIMNIGRALVMTSSTKIFTAMRQLHLPISLSVGLVTALRFLDEILLSLKEIKAGMKIRGFHASLLHPVRTFELYFVPLVYKCLHVSETLVSSIIAKGIEYEGEKTSYYDMRFKFADGISLFAGVALLGVALWTS
ncbi:energy-coupling factor transporter transmembrane component T family protein [Levyella massiliensis]|uniref:energy-coupling factor transporter transmembrane component T family protein n=1 Tax=Levyella massiliensis TaxID=938289 RepID=UPI002AF7E5FC|nr:energy-coupling factor transporter transmembrane protein EcfT [Streptococcus agalactiae]